MRRILLAAVVAVAASLTVVPSTPAAAAVVDPGSEAAFVTLTNDLRTSQGLAPLSVDGELVAKARAWAETMAAAGDIFHSRLSDGVTPGVWAKLGENVGTGPSVGAIHQALVNSPSHYRNLVDPGFRHVGVGVVNINGTLYVSEVFMEPASQPAPSTPAPAAGTPDPRPASATSSPAAAPAPPPPPPPPPRLVATLARLRDLEAA